MSSYLEYYKRVIANHRSGLKLVLGGTGLGKTSSIPLLLGMNLTSGRKCIYMTNRVQLLNEVKDKCEAFKEDVFHVENDAELMLKAIENNSLSSIFENALFRKYIDHINRNHSSSRIDVGKCIRDINFLKEHSSLIKSVVGEEYTKRKVNYLFRVFKTIIQQAKQNTEVKPKNGFAHTDFRDITGLKAFKILFPYIHFKESDNAKLLLVTVQKAFYGFFDGSRNINISSLDGANGNYLVFLDEFDFLENDLIDLICQDIEIDNPFDLVAVFYQRMTKNKLPFKNYLASNDKLKDIRIRIEKIEKTIESLKVTANIPYPDTNHFICSEPQLHGTSVFQSSYSIVSRRIYLDDSFRENSFDLTSRKTDKSAFKLLDVVNNASKRIIRLFKDLEFNHPGIFNEVLNQCFDNTSYAWLIPQIKQMARRMGTQKTNFGDILANGYGLFEIEGNVSQQTDPHEVRFKYYSINTTPERILLQLCKDNLVFGLSATADISRVLRNFDLEWLSKQKIESANFNLIGFNSEDQNDIAEANRQKKAATKNDLVFAKAHPLDKQDKLYQFLNEFSRLHTDIFASREGKKKETRLNRVSLFFATLKWILENKSTENSPSTHLVFLSSFEQIKRLFDTAPENEDGLYKIVSTKSTEYFTFYVLSLPVSGSQITWQNFTIVFYNSNLGRNLNSETEIKNDFDRLFWGKDPVVLVTTYPSAGNGINLQYYPNEQAKKDRDESQLKDFTHIHLLEGKYFYFNGFSSDRPIGDAKNLIKQDIYSLAKLWGKKLLSEGRLKEHLNNIRQVDYYNSEYLSTRDGKLNQLSVFIQALGRIERVWSSMPTQTIRLSREVYQVFEDFCASDEFHAIRNDFERHASNNLISLFNSIKLQYQTNSLKVEDYKEDFLKSRNQHSINAVRSLLAQFKISRNSDGTEFQKKWDDIRVAVLKHEFKNELLKHLHATFNSSHIRDGKIFIDSNLEIIPQHLWSSKHYPWDINRVYRAVNENKIIQNGFKANGYELEFGDTGICFTPYFYQAFLQGAIGETAIKILLNKQGIRFEKLPAELFEVADLKVDGLPIYFDCKHFSEYTLQNFSLSSDDPLWHPKLNDYQFKTAAIEKLNAIKSFHQSQPPCKLVFINFIGAGKRHARYFNEYLEETTIDEAQIILIQGVLDAKDSNKLTGHFALYIKKLLDIINDETYSPESINN